MEWNFDFNILYSLSSITAETISIFDKVLVMILLIYMVLEILNTLNIITNMDKLINIFLSRIMFMLATILESVFVFDFVKMYNK